MKKVTAAVPGEGDEAEHEGCGDHPVADRVCFDRWR